jgi:hypothetical protein
MMNKKTYKWPKEPKIKFIFSAEIFFFCFIFFSLPQNLKQSFFMLALNEIFIMIIFSLGNLFFQPTIFILRKWHVVEIRLMALWYNREMYKNWILRSCHFLMVFIMGVVLGRYDSLYQVHVKLIKRFLGTSKFFYGQ